MIVSGTVETAERPIKLDFGVRVSVVVERDNICCSGGAFGTDCGIEVMFGFFVVGLFVVDGVLVVVGLLVVVVDTFFVVIGVFVVVVIGLLELV